MDLKLIVPLRTEAEKQISQLSLLLAIFSVLFRIKRNLSRLMLTDLRLPKNQKKADVVEGRCLNEG